MFDELNCSPSAQVLDPVFSHHRRELGQWQAHTAVESGSLLLSICFLGSTASRNQGNPQVNGPGFVVHPRILVPTESKAHIAPPAVNVSIVNARVILDSVPATRSACSRGGPFGMFSQVCCSCTPITGGRSSWCMATPEYGELAKTIEAWPPLTGNLKEAVEQKRFKHV